MCMWGGPNVIKGGLFAGGHCYKVTPLFSSAEKVAGAVQQNCTLFEPPREYATDMCTRILAISYSTAKMVGNSLD